MSRQLLFTVYDEAAQAYLPPFFVPAIGLATRAFKDCINSKDHQFGKHPDQYTLFSLGEFFDDTCEILSTNPKSLGNGLEFLDLETGDDDDGPPDPPIQSN